MLPPGARRVADVGAGTGKLTRALLDRGLEVDAVEPDGDMLAELRRVAPEAHAHRAGAEALPLPDASVDVVLAGQAWHWFDHDAAVAEVRRVLRPGGWLGLLWNGMTPVPDGTELGPDDGWRGELARLDPDRPAKLAGTAAAGDRAAGGRARGRLRRLDLGGHARRRPRLLLDPLRPRRPRPRRA